MFLRFRPSEIATAVALSVVADGGRVLDFGGVLESSKLPVDKVWILLAEESHHVISFPLFSEK